MKINESKNRGFGGWEALTIILSPTLLCVATYGLLKAAIVNDDPIAMLMVLGGVVILAAAGVGGYTLTYEAVRRRNDTRTIETLQEQSRAAEILARSLSGIAATSQHVSHELQRQLTEAQKRQSPVLPYPEAPVVWEGEGEVG